MQATFPGSMMRTLGEMSPLRNSTTSHKSGPVWLSPHPSPTCLEEVLFILFPVSSSVWKAGFAQLDQEGHFGQVVVSNVLYQPSFKASNNSDKNNKM